MVYAKGALCIRNCNVAFCFAKDRENLEIFSRVCPFHMRSKVSVFYRTEFVETKLLLDIA